MCPPSTGQLSSPQQINNGYHDILDLLTLVCLFHFLFRKVTTCPARSSEARPRSLSLSHALPRSPSPFCARAPPNPRKKTAPAPAPKTAPNQTRRRRCNDRNQGFMISRSPHRQTQKMVLGQARQAGGGDGGQARLGLGRHGRSLLSQEGLEEEGGYHGCARVRRTLPRRVGVGWGGVGQGQGQGGGRCLMAGEGWRSRGAGREKGAGEQANARQMTRWRVPGTRDPSRINGVLFFSIIGFETNPLNLPLPPSPKNT